MNLLVAALVVIVVLVLFNLPQLDQLTPRGSATSQGTSPQPARNVSAAGAAAAGSGFQGAATGAAAIANALRQVVGGP